MSSVATVARSAATGPVLVTGAGGFIAAHVIQQLLKKGYRVRATVRRIDGNPLVAEILSLVPWSLTPHFRSSSWRPISSRLKDGMLLSVLFSPGSIIGGHRTGCVGVFHVAAVVKMRSSDPAKEILQPSIAGVTHVFEAAARSKTVKKIVLTSSVAASCDVVVPGKVYTEADWNSESTLATAPYSYAKTQAELLAWDLAKKEGIEMEAILPSFVFGPSLLNREVASLTIIEALMRGDFPSLPKFDWGVCDVRNVAEAHVNAYELPNSGNRYIVNAKTLSMQDIAATLRAAYPNRPVASEIGSYLFFWLVFALTPSMSLHWLNSHWGRPFVADNSKSRTQLGITYIAPEDTIRASAASLIAHKRVPTTEQLLRKLGTQSLVLRTAAAGALAVVVFAINRYVYRFW